MKYSHFETLALVLGALAISASVFMAPTAAPQAAEVTAQLLLIVVLGGALHWGRNGGFLAAVIAIAIYVAMRIPLLQAQGLSGDLLTMLGTRTVMYGLVGVIGGEVASRIKYVFAKIENDSLVDSLTGVYSQRYAAESILSGLGQWERYRTNFSLVIFVIDDSLYSGFKSARYRQLMKQVAGHLRNDVRMVDDLAFAAPATFLVLLPGTPEGGASVVSERLGNGVSDLLGAKRESLPATVMSAETSAAAMRALAQSLIPQDEGAYLHVIEDLQTRPVHRRASDDEGRPVAEDRRDAGAGVPAAMADAAQEPSE